MNSKDSKTGFLRGSNSYLRFSRPTLTPIRLLMTSNAIAVALAALLPVPAAAGPLPVPCNGTCGGLPYLGQGTAYLPVIDGTKMTVTQDSLNSILNWESFNVANGYWVHFDQKQGAGSSTLNKIWSADPSVIAGKLTAPGQVYLLNQNGVIFANGAQVNVGALTASSLNLNIDDTTFMNAGPLNDLTKPVFAGTGAEGAVKVEMGAVIETASGGKVMLFAPKVSNEGSIKTPDGQTIMAAGSKIYMLKTDDPAGILVEVDGGGSVTNGLAGKIKSANGEEVDIGTIVAERGNIQLVGYAVNQQGRLSATTSVRSGGSIRLVARDTVKTDSNGAVALDTNGNLQTSNAGDLTLGAGSLTEVTPDASDTEQLLLAQASSFIPSRIELQGRRVDIEGTVRAQGGSIDVSATPNPGASYDSASTPDANTRLYIGDNAVLDTSGVRDVTVDMSRNQLAIQLYSEQLKDAPLQRGGPLYKKTIYVDARTGTPLTDIQPALDLTGMKVGELLSVGGTVKLKSEGDLITKQGSLIDVSGGTLKYGDGFIKTSKLLYQDKVIDISQASPNTPYSGLADVLEITDSKWGVTKSWTLLSADPMGVWQKGYTEGKDAGTVSVISRALALNGTVRGAATVGEYQRDMAKRPKGGQFILGNSASSSANYYTPDVLIQDAPALLPASFGFNDPALAATTTVLDTGFLAYGFNRVAVYGNGKIATQAALRVAPGGSVELKAGQVDIGADIVAPGGTISASAGNTFTSTPATVNYSVSVADGVQLNAAGVWTNDTPGIPGALSAPIVLNGGSVSLKGSNVTLGAGSVVDVSGGAALDNKGKLSKGDAGAITLSVEQGTTGATPGTLANGGELRAYALGKGGTLAVNVSRAQIGGSNPGTPGNWWTDEGFFQRGGFRNYKISAPLGLNVMPGAQVRVLTQNLQLNGTATYTSSGAPMGAVANVVTLPDYLRSAASISLSASTGDGAGSGKLVVGEGASIVTDPGAGASIALAADHSVQVLGELRAPAGAISLTNTGNPAVLAFDSSAGVWVGEKAVISAAGTYRTVPDASGKLKADLFNGGSIKLASGGVFGVGYVVVKQGARLDASGASGEMDIVTASGLERQTLASDGGSIALTGREGVMLDGQAVAAAGGGNARGGQLTLELAGEPSGNTASIYPNSPRTIQLAQTYQAMADGLTAGGTVDSATYNGKARIASDQIVAGGFDKLSLKSRDQIGVDAGVNLNMRSAIELTSPVLAVNGSGAATLAAPYVALRNTDSTRQTTVAAGTPGAGELNINARWIDVQGRQVLSGINQAVLSATLDIRGVPLNIGTTSYAAELVAPSDLTLRARQIYPATYTTFNLRADGHKLRIESSSEAPVPVYSAAGTLNLYADTIEQEGALKAPLGAITLNGGSAATLSENSLSSVSAEGLEVPFGTTQNYFQWLYDNLESSGAIPTFVATLDGANTSSTTNKYLLPPEKRVTLAAPNVTKKSGAKIDLSGGGDLMAYEWLPGTGGSTDYLGDDKGGTRFAVLPSLGSAYAPYDYMYSNGSNVKTSETIYLSGGGGLAAGYYTKLPLRYALLPGAFVVEQKSGYTDMQGGRPLAQQDGTSIVAGYSGDLGSGARDARWSGWQVTNAAIFRPEAGAISRAPSEYRRSYANTFFTDAAQSAGVEAPRLPMDAGMLTMKASNSLVFDGSVIAATDGGRGAWVDIDAPKIEVVSSVGAANGYVQLSADMLTGIGAESLLLGGTRSVDSSGVTVATGASEVIFANDQDHALKAPELIAVATDKVEVKANAYLEAAGTASGSSLPVKVSGDGALLRLGTTSSDIQRTGASQAKGDLIVAAGATLASARAAALDATRNNQFDGSLKLADNGDLYVGAQRISFGDPGATAVTGMLLDNATLAGLGNAENLTLASYTTLDVYGAANLGSSSLNLDLRGSGLVGYQNTPGEIAQITANSVKFSNPNASAFAAAAATPGTGSLKVDAQRVTFGKTGSGTFKMQGYGDIAINSSGDMAASGAGKVEFDAPKVTLAAARITAESGADYAISNANGQMDLVQAGNGMVPETAPAVGAKLALSASKLSVASLIDLSSGDLSLQSTGAGQNLEIKSGAQILARGAVQDFKITTAYAPGGNVSLTSGTGHVVVDAGALVDVSASGDADAGSLSISAVNGAAAVAGQLKGASDKGASGRFTLDAKTINTDTAQTANDFGTLNSALEAGGFKESRSLRVRQGDVNVAGAINAKRFEIAADAGKIDIAAAWTGKHFAAYAQNDLTLKSGANLKGGNGSVTLATANGFLNTDAGSTIEMSGGVVNLRAKRNSSNTDLQIGTLAGDIVGAKAIRAEGYKAYTTTTFKYGSSETWVTEANGFMGKLAAMKSRLDPTGSLPELQIVPGVDINSTGDLTVSADSSLNTLRYDADTGALASSSQLASGQNAAGKDLLPGVLTLRAAGNLIVNGSLSDGFDSAATTGKLQGRQAWSYRLASGADLAAASPLALQSVGALGSKGNFTLASSKLIRTGAGSMQIAVGKDLTLGNDASVIYTAGRSADALAGFTAPTTNAGYFLTEGGNIRIAAQGNITGKIAASGSQQLINNWLFRQGQINPDGSFKLQTAWWLKPELFKQNLATLGGGDIDIEAGGNVVNFSASAPTNARYADTSLAANTYSVLGGGDVSVRARGDIQSGIYYTGRGLVRLDAGGSVKAASGGISTLLALQDASAYVTARNSATIGAVFNPTVVPQSTTNAGTVGSSAQASYFFTYGETAGARVNALIGDATFDSNFGIQAAKFGGLYGGGSSSHVSKNIAIAPGSLGLVSLTGNAIQGGTNTAYLFPAPEGQLRVLGRNNVKLGVLSMSDADVAFLPAAVSPAGTLGTDATNPLNPIRDSKNRYYHAATPVHQSDLEPVRIAALNGTVSQYSGQVASLTVPKALTVYAGKDILNINLAGQNLRADDVTSFVAGRDFGYDQNMTGKENGIRIGGPGYVIASAGRNIDLGVSSGLQAVGNKNNAFLPNASASIIALAGLGKEGAALPAYVAKYIDPAGANYSAATGDALVAYMNKLTGKTLSAADAWTEFQGLSSDLQSPLVYKSFFAELVQTGKDNKAGQGYGRGDEAIATLFPGQDYSGDIRMFNSAINTAREGDIELFAPGGQILVGVANSSGAGIGVVTQQGGDIHAFADSGFYVEASKLITQYGSDIVLWVSNGDIDAGRGSKYATSVPSRDVNTDNYGFTNIEYVGVASGSGIRAQTYDPDGAGPQGAPALGSVYLLAPRGKLNAGDAGIAGGTVFVDAAQVLNADNISASVSVGVPAADASANLAGLTGNNASDATRVADEVTQSLAQTEPKQLAQNLWRPSFITVEVVGLGE